MADDDGIKMTEDERAALMNQLESEMLTAAKGLDFEKAAKLRDRLLALRGEEPIRNDTQNKRRTRYARTRK